MFLATTLLSLALSSTLPYTIQSEVLFRGQDVYLTLDATKGQCPTNWTHQETVYYYYFGLGGLDDWNDPLLVRAGSFELECLGVKKIAVPYDGKLILLIEPTYESRVMIRVHEPKDN